MVRSAKGGRGCQVASAACYVPLYRFRAPCLFHEMGQVMAAVEEVTARIGFHAVAKCGQVERIEDPTTSSDAAWSQELLIRTTLKWDSHVVTVTPEFW